MASQPKITSFYRTTKQTGSIGASKRRKAVLQEEKTLTVPTNNVEAVLEATKDAVSKIVLPKLESATSVSNEEDAKNLLNIPVTKRITRSKKVTGSINESVKLASQVPETDNVTNEENIKKEATSYEDSHKFNPIEVTTPQHPSDNSLSTRKRKMESAGQTLTANTPKQIQEKAEKKTEIRTPIKVRKRLDMGGNCPTTPKQIEDLKIESEITNSPSKSIQFLCLGTLSPRKQGMDSPSKQFSSPRLTPKHLTPKALEKTPIKSPGNQFKSPAVKSLSSLLDKVSPVKKVISCF